MELKRLRGCLERCKKLKIAVIGDVMLDEYLWGRVERISPEAPVQVVDVVKEESDLGGAGNVVKNLVPWGPKVYIFSVVGKDAPGDAIVEKFERLGVDTRGIIRLPRRTTVKTRVIAESQQVVRIDREERSWIGPEATEILLKTLKDVDFDGVIISDYGKGVVSKELVKGLRAFFRGKVTVDPKTRDLSKYPNVSFVKPNKKEFWEIARFEGLEGAGFEEAGKAIKEKYSLEGLLVTMGPEGMVLFTKDRVERIEGVKKEVFDVTGAGDTAIAVFSTLLFSGEDPLFSARIANSAAGISVTKVGAKAVTPYEVVSSMEGYGKLVPLDILPEFVKGKKVVMTSGCFDLIHPGQILLLKEAKKLGDTLVVALNSDSSIKRLKGEGRPVLDLEERVGILSHLPYVDYIVVFDEETPSRVIELVKPRVYVKGKGISPEELPEKKALEEVGSEIVVFPELHSSSTATIIERIKNSL